MQNFTFKNRILLLLVVLVGFSTACKKKDEDAPAPSEVQGYRTTKIDYNTLNATTSYKTPFLLANGDSTIDRTEGRNRLRMFKGLFAYIRTATSSNAVLDSTTMSNMFANENSSFTATYADINGLNYSIKSSTASSLALKDEVHLDIEHAFGRMAYISQFTAQTASKGTAGKNGNYLVDEDGIEWAQVIQKSLIGAYHLDYISNVLLSAGLNADNHELVAGKKYTQLEHNWDVAYGFLTFNDIYGMNATTTDSGENYLGSYIWEFNQTGFDKLHSVFLKGRAAIHNNDMTEVKAQALIIRNILESTVGGAANGYMGEVSNPGSKEDIRIHAFGEGYGFLYATRFCKIVGCDTAYSEDLMDDLIHTTTPTFYDIIASQFTTVSNKLKIKFGLQ